MSHSANACIPVEEFISYRTEIRNQAKSAAALPDADADIPPGEEEADDHLVSSFFFYLYFNIYQFFNDLHSYRDLMKRARLSKNTS